MGRNPSHFKRKNLPVENVSWNDCQNYIRQLNALNVASAGYKFSLPTEAQWEYACRAKTTTAYHFGDVLNGDKANFDGRKTRERFLGATTEVGFYHVTNAWGLLDMHGNVREFCLDWHDNYPNGSVTDPTGALAGSWRVIRGGSWDVDAVGCRSALRDGLPPSGREKNTGLRLSLVPKE